MGPSKRASTYGRAHRLGGDAPPTELSTHGEALAVCETGLKGGAVSESVSIYGHGASPVSEPAGDVREGIMSPRLLNGERHTPPEGAPRVASPSGPRLHNCVDVALSAARLREGSPR